MQVEFINVKLYDGSVVQFSKEQWDFIAWALNHGTQLKRIKDSKALDNGGSSFEVLLKPTVSLQEIPVIDKIKLHWNG